LSISISPPGLYQAAFSKDSFFTLKKNQPVMQVLKFGGSSVANAENINKVITLVRGTDKRQDYPRRIRARRHHGYAHPGRRSPPPAMSRIKTNCRRSNTATSKQSNRSCPSPAKRALSAVKTRCNEIEDICSGIFLLGELSARTQDKVVSYGELLSSLIVAARFAALDIDHIWKDSRELIRTDSHFGHAAVDFPVPTDRSKIFYRRHPSTSSSSRLHRRR
jgi:aspartokinase/homoserine dehydrogenase 1